MAKSFEIKLSNEKIKPLLDKLKSWCDRGQLEPRNYEVLTKMITKCENYDDAISILEIATQSRKTGLFYRHQFEKIDTNKIHYLEEDKSMSFGNKGIVNKLIIGDNYLALENLLISYRGKIDVIYIDPPYGCNDMGEYAGMNYENNISRDNLLSQLSPRLELAHQLLSNNGVIFCSIDDKNQAYIKCLFDDIFEEKNFISCFPRITTTSGKNDEKLVGRSHDYILMYSKSKIVSLNKDNNYDKTHYHNYDNDPHGLYQDSVVLDSNSLPYQKTLDYPIVFHDKTFYPGEKNNQRGKVCWRWGKDKVKFGIKNNIIVEKNGRLYTKGYLNFEIKRVNGKYKFVEKKQGKTIKSLLFDEVKLTCEKYSNRIGTKELLKLNLNFDNPKPPSLIKKLITLIPNNENSIILDFYAGSGTTGQAVLELNKEDKGNRKFILCTNEDKMNGKLIHGIGTDITYERLRRIMIGQSSDNSNFQWIKENDAYGQILKVYKIAEMENFKKEIFKLINPLDYDYKSLSEKKKIEWICKNFEQTQKILEEKK